MPNFDDVRIDIFADSPGGEIQLKQRSDALEGLSYRITKSVVSGSVAWANRLPGGSTDTAPITPGTSVLMLIAVKP